MTSAPRFVTLYRRRRSTSHHPLLIKSGLVMMLKGLVFLCVLPLVLSTRAFAQKAPVTDCYYTLAPRAWCDFRPWGTTPPPQKSELQSLDNRRLPGDGVQIGQKWPHARLTPWRGPPLSYKPRPVERASDLLKGPRTWRLEEIPGVGRSSPLRWLPRSAIGKHFRPDAT
jgi:hypothetical protein